ncbi:hypothetical protein QR685DRAFT_70787 [Neurospora intermedia]|uniref:Secreted protein n=1 Tax=Neurospora intermedia TaxID=5142 RepID=A0ABR3DU04_NEUIN
MGTTCWLLHFHIVFLCWFSRCTGFANSSMVYSPLILVPLWRVPRTRTRTRTRAPWRTIAPGVVHGIKSITGMVSRFCLTIRNPIDGHHHTGPWVLRYQPL